MGLSRAAFPAELRRHHRAEAGRRAEPRPSQQDDQANQGSQRAHSRARGARAREDSGVPGRADGRAHRTPGRFGPRCAGRRRLSRAVRRQREGAARRHQPTMSDIFWLLWPPFLVAVCLVGIHTYFGLQVLARNVIFVDLALAQIAALGTTVAYMLGHPPQSTPGYGYSLLFTLLAAVLLACTRSWSQRLPQEALIGVIYVMAAAAAIVLIDRAPQGAEHLKQILTGNILLIGLESVAVIAPLYAAIGIVHWLLRSRLKTGSFAW